MKIIIGSDIVPTKSNREYFETGKINKIIDENVLNIINKADFRIFNLECPLGENLTPIDKYGPNLITSKESIKGIKKINPDVILLANNHILDYGKQALNETIKILQKNNIKYTGIVKNTIEEFDGIVISKNSKKVGIYNLCEHEFSVATENLLGTNPLNLLKNCLEISKLKKKVDYVIVIFHGGKEFYRYPSPDLQKNCRKFIDFGADCVITQHSHCIGCEENYKNKKIVYGQGNFIFDRKDDEFWNTELLIEINIDNEFEVTYYPLEKIKGKYFLSEDKSIMREFFSRSKSIEDKNFIDIKYKEFSKKILPTYLYAFNKANLIEKVLNKITKKKYILNKYSKKDCLAILNFIECEAHRELLIKGLKEKIENE